MSLKFLKNCSYKKSFRQLALFFFFYQSIQETVINAICFLPSSLLANKANISINFQQKIALVKSFQHFAIKFLTTLKEYFKTKYSRTLKEYFKIFVKLARKCNVFLLELYLAIDPRNLASENDVTQLRRASDACAKITSCL